MSAPPPLGESSAPPKKVGNCEDIGEGGGRVGGKGGVGMGGKETFLQGAGKKETSA